MRLAAIVLGQCVVAEVGGEIAPYRMDVVGAVLGVVVLDQRRRPVDAEVIGLARSERAGPREAEAVEALLHHALLLAGDEVGRQRRQESLHQGLDALARGAIHDAELETARLAEILLTLRARHDLAERAVGDQRRLPLRVV